MGMEGKLSGFGVQEKFQESFLRLKLPTKKMKMGIDSYLICYFPLKTEDRS